jgi:hypothetical protein
LYNVSGPCAPALVHRRECVGEFVAIYVVRGQHFRHALRQFVMKFNG